MRYQQISLLLLACLSSICLAAPEPPVIGTGGGRLTYVTDDHGNRVPDFSYAGYHGGDSIIPTVPVRVVVSPMNGDNTARIQSAIDYVASLPSDQRGAVLLLPGKYDLAGGLRIAASGVVLRGSGIGKNGTTLLATGTDRRTLITFAGKNDRQIGTAVAVADSYVPVNATKLKVNGGQFKVGDTVLIRRPCTPQWIKQLGVADLGGGEGLGWKPNTREVMWDTTVTAVDGNGITIDSPLTTALDSEMGGGQVAGYSWPGRISEVGVENLAVESIFDQSNPKDEAHSWFAITMENVRDGWVRRMTMTHFAASAVTIFDSCKRITTEDCRSIAPISEIAGYRRHTFFTNGQQTLFQRCWSENGRHDFAVGFCAPGPNAFVQCEAQNALDDSGPIDSWASGVLYDNIRLDGNAITLGNRYQNQQFAGWAAANSMLWQCFAAQLNCFSPPGAKNYAAFCWGQYAGDGHWEGCDKFAKPTSLYYAQLADRIGGAARERTDWMAEPFDASSSPTVEQAAVVIAASTQPAQQLSSWIDTAATRHPMSLDPGGAKTLEQLAIKSPPASQPSAHHISIENGWIVSDGQIVTGGRLEIAWWQGGVRPTDVAAAKICLTRNVPGRNGWGLTDDLDELSDWMLDNHMVALEHHYGLWYDRRDDDHERVRRMNGDAWPPFYELPFARSGIGLEQDGLSKYDLMKYNPWYWSRLKQFADLADQKGLVLIHNNFFQHNILEAGAHWASCPWRSLNNINDMGFPEPPPYAGDKRIFMAEQWYDLSNPNRKAVYRAYIRKCMDNFAENSNVIQLTGAEFTGPLHFVQFWIDTIGEWEKETGRHPIIGLSCTKDVQDEILNDPARSKIVNVIDMQYWWYQANGEPYAPIGGQNLAPRQYERVMRHGATNMDQVVRAVREYRTKFPDKAVISSGYGYAGMGWATFVGGGSLPQINRAVDPKFLAALAKMKPVDLPGNPAGQWALSDGGKNEVIFCRSEPRDSDTKGFNVNWLDPSPVPGVRIAWLTHQ